MDTLNNGLSGKKIKGTVVLMEKNAFLNFNDKGDSVVDHVNEFLGKDVSLQLVSAVHPGN